MDEAGIIRRSLRLAGATAFVVLGAAAGGLLLKTAVSTSRIWLVGQSNPGCSVIARQDRTLSEIRQLVQESSHGAAKVERLLPDHHGGLVGALIAAEGQRFIAWVTPDCSALLVGALFGRDGKNISVAAMNSATMAGSVEGAQPADSFRSASTAVLLYEASKARGVLDGTRGPIVHAFVDLRCTFCLLLYSQLKPLIGEGRLRVHWIPVAVLSESSQLEAAAVLESTDPLAAFREHQGRFSSGGAGLSGKRPTASTMLALAANDRLLRRVNEGVAATPVMLFQGRDGSIVHLTGALRQLSELLSIVSPTS